MAIYRYDDIIDSNVKILDSSTQKLDGLIKLKKMNILSPEWIYLDSNEFNYFIQNKHLSNPAQMIIRDFILYAKQKYNPCLFAIRAESKLNSKSASRPPLSLLNVGINSIEKDKNFNVMFWNKVEKVYNERWHSVFTDSSNLHLGESTIVDEIKFNLECFYQSMYNKLKFVVDFDYGVIIQKMVFGHITQCSGSGILCRSYDGELNGVFMYGEQGMGVLNGSWGENEVDIHEWRERDSVKYNELLLIMQQLEAEYGKECYLEFTLENSDLYILDYKIGKRNINVAKC